MRAFLGQTANATASGADQNGAPIATGTVTWSSTNQAVATVNSAGTVTAVSAGQTVIVASVGTKSGQLTVTVTAIPVTTTVSVTLSSATVVQGKTVTATATALDQNG